MTPQKLLFLACLAPLSAAFFTHGEPQDTRREPRVFNENAPRIGEWIRDHAFQTPDGAWERLSGVAGPRGLVLAFRDPGCPISRKYAPRLTRLERELEESGFGLLLVNPLSRESAQEDVQTFGFDVPYAVDSSGRLATDLVARSSAEVFLLDAARTLVYRGMIDDQYGLGFTRERPTHSYLEDAIAAVAAGQSVTVPATEAQGCLLDLSDRPAPALEPRVTWHERISRISQKRCQRCHRDGASGPFRLETPRDFRRRKGMIRYVLEQNLMPPWFATEETGPWKNDWSLTEAEKSDLLGWLESGMPEGDAGNAPLDRPWPDGWTIGEPDYVVEVPETFTVPAEGAVPYQYGYVQIDLPADRWVQAVEILPSSPEVVHHVLVWLEEPMTREERQAAREDGSFKLLNDYFAATAPGQAGVIYPDGFGRLLPAKSWLKFQFHFTPNGVETQERTKIGFVFSDGPAEREVLTDMAVDFQFVIPPGSTDYPVTGEYVFPEDGTLLSLFPHTHLRGTRFRYELVHPDGGVENLLWLPFYDFNWQLVYELEEPRQIAKGTKLVATGWYDNSATNPANPNPRAAVRFGTQIWDEMLVGFFHWSPDRTER